MEKRVLFVEFLNDGKNSFLKLWFKDFQKNFKILSLVNNLEIYFELKKRNYFKKEYTQVS